MTLGTKISTASNVPEADSAEENRLGRKRGLFWEARTRILACYLALMAFFVGISIPLFYQLVFYQVDRRVRDDLAEEIEAFEEFIEERAARDATLSEDDTAALFDAFLSRVLPEDDTFLLTFLDGQFYRASTLALPEPLQRDSELLNRWAQLTESDRGTKPTADPALGNLLYIAEPILQDGQVVGGLVAVHTTAGERQEAMGVVILVVQVLLGVLLLAVILAWVASWRILTPVRSLAQAARSISETDLTQRIPMRGSGEMADLAKTFNEMMERLEAAFKSQRDFINDAGHELRTPITIIQGHLELLDPDDPQEREETLALVTDELSRMSRFVEDLILLAKTRRPDFLKLETIEIGSLTEELYAKAKGLAPRNWQLQSTGNGQIVADRQRITQAVMNLAQNATQHTTEDKTIALGSALDRSYAYFWVRDTGEGIAPDDRERIFDRFARAANSRRRSEGAGLGLSIVRAIAQAHGGRVELFSRQGTGSKFTLVLPLEPPHKRIIP
jgi:signal transduction histidine kinase